MPIKIWVMLGLFAAFLFACGGCEKEGSESRQPQVTPLPSPHSPSKERLHTIIIKGIRLNVEIARTPEERGRGLMFRKSLPQDQGMLFIYEDSDIRSFYMKNTYIPLSLAYIDENCQIVQLVDMEPLEEESYLSVKPAQFVLEVNRGWFEKNNVKVGDIVKNIPR
jgi:uncharacterized membrane protein (UPF0127 family)